PSDSNQPAVPSILPPPNAWFQPCAISVPPTETHRTRDAISTPAASTPISRPLSRLSPEPSRQGIGRARAGGARPRARSGRGAGVSALTVGHITYWHARDHVTIGDARTIFSMGARAGAGEELGRGHGLRTKTVRPDDAVRRVRGVPP